MKRWPVVALSLGVLGVWGGWWWIVPMFIPSEQNQGLSGDMFGSLNALFSAGAFIGLTAALLLQRHELHEQQETAKKAQEHMDRQQLQLELQSQVSAQQARITAQQIVESTLLNLLQLLRSIVADMPRSGRMFTVALNALVEEPVVPDEKEGLRNFAGVWTDFEDDLRSWIAVLDQLFRVSRRAHDSKQNVALVLSHLSSEQRAVLALCSRAKVLPEFLDWALHAYGAYVEINGMLWGKTLVLPMRKWVEEKHEEARPGVE